MKAIRWTPEQLAQHHKKLVIPKFKNIKTLGYDSKRESNRATDLRMMAQAGLIQDLREQVEFELIPVQYINGKCVERAMKYIADFAYTENGQAVVEDVKGYRTDVYRIKRKLMLHFHGIRIKEL